MPCPLRVVVVAASALLLAFVALAPGADVDELRVEGCDGERSSEARTLARAHRWLRLTSVLRAQKTPPSGPWATRRKRVSELLRAAWELASGRVIWRALVQSRAGTLRRRDARVARTAEARVCVSR